MFDQHTAELKRDRLALQCRAMFAKAEHDGNRDLTADETKQHDEYVKEIEALGKSLSKIKSDQGFAEQLEALTGTPATDRTSRIVIARGREVKSIGQQFAEHEAYDAWRRDARHRSHEHWISPVIEVKAVLTEDPASGGGLVVPDYQVGIIPRPLPPPMMVDLLAPGTTDSNAVPYMQETAFTNAAAPVAEGAAKPESAITFTAVTEPVRKIAHWLPATEEILEDVPTLRSYIDARLRLGVRVKFDDQLLNGSGVPPAMLGFLNRAGLAPAIVRTDPETNADAILRQIAAIQTATNLPPDGIVMNPTNWTASLLVKTTTGEYVSGATPFQAPPLPTLWGIPVALTAGIAAGTALVGSFRGAAQLFMRGPLNVAATNSHQDFFIKNLVAIRAEQRAALCVYVPAAFGVVTGLTATAVTLEAEHAAKRR